MSSSQRGPWVLAVVLSVFCIGRLHAQTAPGAEALKREATAVAEAEPQAAGQRMSSPPQVVPALPVPRLIKFSGVVKDASCQPRTGVVGLTFSIYKDQEGGTTLNAAATSNVAEEKQYTITSPDRVTFLKAVDVVVFGLFGASCGPSDCAANLAVEGVSFTF